MKDERIRVLVAKDPCENCKLKPCARKCMFAQMYEKGPAIAKSDAIKKMAKAICHRHCPEKICTSCDEWEWEKYGIKEDAEAALNALLEDKK